MNNKFRIVSLATFTFYSILNGIIYQWSFWVNFDINIMQFISINDLLPSIAFSVALPIALLGLYAFLMSFIVNTKTFNKTIDFIMGHNLSDSISNVILTPEIKAVKTPKLRMGYYYLICFAGCAVVIILAAIIIYRNPNFGFKNLAMIAISSSLGWLLYKSEDMRITLGKHFMPIVLIIALIPYIMVVSGTINANDIIRGKNSLIVKSAEICNKNKDEKYRYIANISDKAFAYSLTDHSVCIFKYDSLLLIKENTIIKEVPTPLPYNRA